MLFSNRKFASKTILSTFGILAVVGMPRITTRWIVAFHPGQRRKDDYPKDETEMGSGQLLRKSNLTKHDSILWASEQAFLTAAWRSAHGETRGMRIFLRGSWSS
ncbi:MAG: hypothetical protein EPO43_07890 [Rugosibacter sp.]|nr:MAG: hypothetical protein EPO43_07890 [Rugosibacter sp.]